MTTPTPEQITAYLSACGWKRPAETSSGRWTSPDGKAIRYRGEAMKDDSDYHQLLRAIAVSEGCSTLAVGLAIDGHAIPDDPEADLAAIGAAIAVWRLATEHPKKLYRLTQTLDIGLEDVAPPARGELLDRFQGGLESLRDLIGTAADPTPALPATLPATDRRPRRLVWAEDPDLRTSLAPWPEPLHLPLLDAVVDEETAAINTLLDANLIATGEEITEWRWDPHQAAATHYSGDRRHQDVPEADTMLAEVREQVFDRYDLAEARTITTWVGVRLRHLAAQEWTVGHRTPVEEHDIGYTLNRDQRIVLVSAPEFFHPGEPPELSEAERAMYLRLTADLTELTAADPATEAFPATAAEAGSEADQPSIAGPLAAEETGPIR